MLIDLSENLNHLINAVASSLKSKQPLGGKVGLTAAMWGTGITAMYFGTSLLTSGLSLGLELTVLAPIAIYFCRFPDLRKDCRTVIAELKKFAGSPIREIIPLSKKFLNFFYKNLRYFYQGINSLTQESVINYLKKILTLLNESPLDFICNIIGLTLTTVYFGHTLVFGTLALAPEFALTAAFASSAYFAAQLRNNPELWDREVDTFISQKNVLQKAHHLTMNMISFSLQKWYLTTCYIINEQRPDITPFITSDNGKYIDCKGKNELPEELLSASKLLLLATNSTSNAFRKFKPS